MNAAGRSGRIIPARAGFTAKRRPLSMAAADHPRSRGVYETPRLSATSLTGSSPLARGLPQLALDRHVHGRIIPARAGFTPLNEKLQSSE